MGMVEHFTTLEKAYSGNLVYYLVPLELDRVDHTNTTTFVKILVAKVDLTVGVQRILHYKYIWHFNKLLPVWLGELGEFASTHVAFNSL